MAAERPFVHLRVHTEYSLLRSLCRTEALAARAIELGMTAVGATDTGALYGAAEFERALAARGLKAVIGCELAWEPPAPSSPRAAEPPSVALLAETPEGCANLVRLVSEAHLAGPVEPPRLTPERLDRHRAGLLVLSGGWRGPLGPAAAEGDTASVERAARALAEIVGPDRLFLEVQDHGLRSDAAARAALRAAARRAGLATVATHDVFYLRPAEAPAHDVLACLRAGTTMDDPRRPRLPSAEFYLRTPEEMWARLGDDEDALRRTIDLADRCCASFEIGGRLHFPRFPLPPEWAAANAGLRHREFAYLQELARAGLARRYGLADPTRPGTAREKEAVERLAAELDIIHHTGFVNYFLVVWDFVRHAREAGIVVGPGRGSGAGSLVAYALGITGIDPLRRGLVFERFLNPERVSAPDFDIDFCQERRGEVIDYVRRRYGEDRVAQIIAFGTLGARAAIRDVARALGEEPATADRLVRFVPDEADVTLARALAASPAMAQAEQSDPPAARILPFARAIEGLPRSPGTHAAGVVIADQPLSGLVPLTRDREGAVVTQFDMNTLARLGLLKMDFLGLRTLTVIHHTVEALRAAGVAVPDLDALPEDDPETLALLNRGDTVGVFQVESAGMRELLRQVRVDGIADLTALIALYRPGPMAMLETYVRRKLGGEPVTYEHPRLEAVLRETCGVMIYQEQVQQAAHALAGFSMGQGDLLRRAMAKKDIAEMSALRRAFVEGCRRHSRIPAPAAGHLFDLIQRFAGYGFSKSHSAAYAVLAWQTAWLKAHHPAAFLAASISSEDDNPDRMARLCAEARTLGLDLLPPDLNRSGVRFSPEGRSLRFGLAGLRHVGREVAGAWVRQREAGGSYRGLLDFCARNEAHHLNRRLLESLVGGGAFDFTGLPRGRLWAGIDAALARTAAERLDRKRHQMSLFDPTVAAVTDEDLPAAEPWPEGRRLSVEREILGCYVSGHPLAAWQWLIERIGLDRADRGEGPVRVAGLVTDPEPAPPARERPAGHRFRIETLSGMADVFVPQPVYERCAGLVTDGRCVAVSGRLGGARAQVWAEGLADLSDVPERLAREVRLHVATALAAAPPVDALRGILRRHAGPLPVTFCIASPDGSRVFLAAGADYRVRLSADLVTEVEQMLGEHSLFVVVDWPPIPARGHSES